jgi:hypothetical protein
LKLKLSTVVLALALSCGVSVSQSPTVSPQLQTSRLGFPVYSTNATPVPGASLQVVGISGQATWCYWASANFQIGSVLSSLGCVNNAPNMLSASNYISIIPFSYPPGVSTIDILATSSSSVAPTGACNCAVATGLVVGGATQQSNSLSSYTVSIVSPSSYRLWITNEVVGAGSSHLLLRNEAGALVSDFSSIGTGLPTGVAPGSLCASNGVGQPCIYQNKAAKDVRDFGVICGLGIDNTIPFQAAINGTPNFSELDIPLGCRIEVTSTINVHTVQGLWIKAKGGQRPGVLSQQMPSVVWEGADHGGPVFDINCASWMIWDGFAVFLQDGISGHNSDIGLDIRQATNCPSITTHNVFQNMSFESEGPNASRVMIRIGNGPFAGNVEQQLFYNSTMIGDMGLGVFSTTQGIGLEVAGQEPVGTIWDGGATSGLTYGFYMTTSNITVSNSIGGNYTNIYCAAICNSHDNRWEFSVLPWVMTAGSNVMTERDGISSQTSPNPIFTLPDGGVSANLVIRDFGASGTNVATTFSTLTTPMTSGAIVVEGKTVFPDIPVWSNYCVFSCRVSVSPGSYLFGSGVASPATYHGIGLTLQSNQTGAGNLPAISPALNLTATHHSPDSDTFSLLNMDGALAWVHSGTAPLGPAGFGFSFSALSLTQIPTPSINSVSPHGTAGSTTYTYQIVEHSQSGTTPGSATSSTATGNATLSSTNYNVIQWTPDLGVTSTDIYRTVGGATQGFIGTVLPGANNGTNWTFFFNDTGLTGDGTTAPTTNSTGLLGLTPVLCANLPTGVPNGKMLYCQDCKNATDDGTGTFDSAAACSGHGTNVLRENGAWRVH